MTDPLLGTTFARHRVEAVLGQGGMGTVYLATDERLERQVALKVLPAERAADPAFRERFLREGRLLASLHHEHIVTVFEADEWQGQLYLAMRYVAGPDLRSIIERDGPLTPARAVALLGQVADALDTAHAASLVHRDIKPGNILVLPDPDPLVAGHAYLTDFGLTKPAGAATSGLTMAGQFVGTPGYVAPEQIEGKSAVDHRADIYALGCVLYNALTGDIPYPRDSTMAVLWAHVWEPAPRISDRAPELVPFDGVLATALAKEPAKRYQTAGAFAAAAKQALAALGRAHDGATPPPGTHPPVYEHTATDLLRLDGRREEEQSRMRRRGRTTQPERRMDPLWQTPLHQRARGPPRRFERRCSARPCCSAVRAWAPADRGPGSRGARPAGSVGRTDAGCRRDASRHGAACRLRRADRPGGDPCAAIPDDLAAPTDKRPTRSPQTSSASWVTSRPRSRRRACRSRPAAVRIRSSSPRTVPSFAAKWSGPTASTTASIRPRNA